jgi:hypothetical protein
MPQGWSLPVLPLGAGWPLRQFSGELLRLEYTGGAAVGGSPLNKGGFCLFLIRKLGVVLLSLAGRGGEGREEYGAEAAGSEGGMGDFAGFLLRRGGNWQPSRSASSGPWWTTTELVLEAVALIKRWRHFLSAGLPALLFLLAGQGGEGEGGSDGLVAEFRRWRGIWCKLSFPTVALCRPSICAAGRHPSTPMRRFFNLCVRPCIESAAAFPFALNPSGMFPGVGADGRGVTLFFSGGGGDRGLDCSSIFCSKVVCAKFQDLFVIFHFFEVLCVTCTGTAVF